ncbi:hypothetical protein HPP92_005000 [Vanilla planifolia]|uniref:Dicer-like protein 4 n=1 Tax=Vanilla planifolia TaxID=51239 RepID=A0A835VEZ1_VANPL|nr:hypothetical protein HPP92_005000 [Vanilla planifolia]
MRGKRNPMVPLDRNPNRACRTVSHHRKTKVFVMTPDILLYNLRHCFVRMELIALLIFDECHHAQAQTRHPYAQIMKEFYNSSAIKCPRIFGMTASPITGKGGSNQVNYTKCINSLENLLDAKVYSVDDKVELESISAIPDVKIYFYGPVDRSESQPLSVYCKKLDLLKQQFTNMLRGSISDSTERHKKIKLLWRIHNNLIFCTENLGLYGTLSAIQILSSSESQLSESKEDERDSYVCIKNQYLLEAASILGFDIYDDNISTSLDILEVPFCSAKLSLLIGILSTYRIDESTKCIIFVKRIVVAIALARILKRLKCLVFWKIDFLVGFHSGLRNMSRSKMNAILEEFSSGKVNLLVATNVAEEGLDIQTCCFVVRFDLPQTVASFIQSRGRARMQKSEFIFLLERGNVQDEKLLTDFMSGEDFMNREIVFRTSDDTFDDLNELVYRVENTGASISTAYSVSLLHHYCSKLPKDKYFSPIPKFFFIDDKDGTVCRLILPPNAPLRQVDSLPCASKDEAKRAACLTACRELHERGALTDFLLPGFTTRSINESASLPSMTVCSEILSKELHKMVVPAVLKGPWPYVMEMINLHFYYIRFTPIPDDRKYREFGLFLLAPIPNDAEAMEVDLHLARGRIVKTGFVNCGKISFNKEEILLAQNFQEMFLKIILDRSEFCGDSVTLGNFDASHSLSFYLLLPVTGQRFDNTRAIDWKTVKCCLSSPVFSHDDLYGKGYMQGNTLELYNGPVNMSDVSNSLIFVPHNQLFFFVDCILHEKNAHSQKGSFDTSYMEHYLSRFGVYLSYPEQPLLKAKPLFNLRNLLHNRIQEYTEAREIEEHFVELPPELCSLKIVGFSKDIGSSLSLLPSLMHRLENLLVAIELKDVLSTSFPEASGIRADIILEALTTERCMERFSLERFEVLGDAFLKYVVSRHCFLSYDGLDEGQLTRRREILVKNLNLCELAIKNNLHMYIRDELFEPSLYFPLGRPCTQVCSVDTESTLHCFKMKDGTDYADVKCNKCHHWLQRKTIADAVEALVGAFLVESGFKAAISFLRWLGLSVDYEIVDVYKILEASKINLSLNDVVDVKALEESLGYKFKHRGLLLQAFVHPSYDKHHGGCYQNLEFLGDAVLEYLITSYLYSVYPVLKPGQITDLRSVAVSNNSFAHIAVWWGFQRFLIKDSKSLTAAVNKFERSFRSSSPERGLLDESKCPKVLGDLVESYIGAMLLDSGFNLIEVWKIMLALLEPVLSFNCLNINPVRELRELCEQRKFCLRLPQAVKEKESYLVEVEVNTGDGPWLTAAVDHNSNVARRVAAQKALSKLKDLGYRHKKKSLEEILKATPKKQPELIGFNEDTIAIKVQMTNFNLSLPAFQSSVAAISSMNELEERLSLSECWQATMVDETLDLGKRQQNARLLHFSVVEKATESNIHESCTDIATKKSAKSQLLEICTANYWSPPLYECFEDEGACHQKMFTFKVIVRMEGTSTTILESYSESKPRKKAAEQHAAEGALWYLKHHGFYKKS